MEAFNDKLLEPDVNTSDVPQEGSKIEQPIATDAVAQEPQSSSNFATENAEIVKTENDNPV